MRVRACLPALLILATLVSCLTLLLPTRAPAAGISLGFAGAGVYPQLSTANSQRWFRLSVNWDPSLASTTAPDIMPKEVITGLTMDGMSFNAGYGAVGSNLDTVFRGANPQYKGVATTWPGPSSSASTFVSTPMGFV